MTCRHMPGDPNCSSHPVNIEARQYEYDVEQKAKREMEARTPDAEKYEIIEFVRIGDHVVMKVRYPNCSKCSYEGNKVMVFLNVSETDIIRWRKIDPHFRDSKAPIRKNSNEAPGPAARFPASEEGWKDALAYAGKK